MLVVWPAVIFLHQFFFLLQSFLVLQSLNERVPPDIFFLDSLEVCFQDEPPALFDQWDGNQNDSSPEVSGHELFLGFFGRKKAALKGHLLWLFIIVVSSKVFYSHLFLLNPFHDSFNVVWSEHGVLQVRKSDQFWLIKTHSNHECF